MNPIDLVEETKHSDCLDPETLGHASYETEEISSWRILSAYFMDFGVITTGTFLFAKVLELAFHNYMGTGLLSNSFGQISFASMTFRMLPFMFFNYYFFSFFFNHGQSWGLHTIKSRINMPHQSFRSCFYWAVFSTSVVMTGGIAFLTSYEWVKEKTKGEIKTHDHLYWDLVQVRDVAQVNLVEMASQTKTEVNIEENYYKEAA